MRGTSKVSQNPYNIQLQTKQSKESLSLHMFGSVNWSPQKRQEGAKEAQNQMKDFNKYMKNKKRKLWTEPNSPTNYELPNQNQANHGQPNMMNRDNAMRVSGNKLNKS